MRDGDPVSYVGDERPGLPRVGDRGKVVSGSVGSGHVQWTTGSCKGQIHLVEDAQVVVSSGRERHSTVASSMADSLEISGHHLAVRETFEESGEVGLLNAMAETGHLQGLAVIAEATQEFVAARLREEPAFAAALAALEPAEADSLVSTASAVLLRDFFTPEGD
jgi:hypothetical protein